MRGALDPSAIEHENQRLLELERFGTTMIRARVLNRGSHGVRSPAVMLGPVLGAPKVLHGIRLARFPICRNGVIA